MTPNKYVLPAIITILVIMAVGMLIQGIQARGRWLEREKDLQYQVDSTNTLLASYTADSTRWKREGDSLALLVSTRAGEASKKSQALSKALSQKARVEHVLDSLLGDSTTPVVIALKEERLHASKTLELARGVIEAQKGEIEALTRRTASDSTRIASLETLKSRLLSERDSSRALNKPTSLVSLTFELGAGPGCAVGLGGQATCGISLQATVIRFRIPLLP